MAGIIWTIIVVLFALWLIGLLAHIGGGLVYILLVIAVILVVYNLLTGRGARI
ncbi:MAG: lmo0937 family membrane protein [Vulcanimicrobiaceae bacterium]